MEVGVGRYALGAVSLLIVCGSLGWMGVVLRRHHLPEWDGAAARLAEVVIGLLALALMLVVLGTLGLFELGPVLVVSILVGVASSWRSGARAEMGGHSGWRRASPVPAIRATGQRALPASTGLMALLAVAVLTAEWARPTLGSFGTGIRTFDSLWYHLPWAASYAQTGQITSLRFTDVEYLTAFYPATAELVHGLGIVLLSRDILSPALNLFWLGLVLLAAYAIGRPRGLGPTTLLGAALAMATPMMVFSQAGSAANDVVGVFFVLASVALVLNAGASRFAFGLAALAAGVAVSVKLSMAAPVLALTIGVLVIGPSGKRAARAVLWLGGLVLAGGFWYLRNLIAVGNPLPWLDLPGLATPTPALQQHTAFSVSHYLPRVHVLGAVIEPGLASGLGPWWTVILVLALIGPLLCLAPDAGRTLRMLALVALASTVAYLITPETAAGPAGRPLGFAFNLRYAAPALTLSLAILPLAPPLATTRRRRVGVAGGLGLVLIATLSQGRLWRSADLAGAIAIGLTAGLMGVVAAARRARGPSARRAPRVALIACAGLLLATAAVAGYAGQRHYLKSRYVYRPRVSRLAPVWAFFRGVHRTRVGLVGTFGGFFSYPLYGLDVSNRVQYIAARGPHGSFTALESCSAWRAAVNALHVRYLLTTPARDPWHPNALGFSPERSWTASDPAAQLVFQRYALGQTISVFRLRGRLNPTGCR